MYILYADAAFMNGSERACSFRLAISALCRLFCKSSFWADVRTFLLGLGLALAFFFLGFAFSFWAVVLPLVFFAGAFFGASLGAASVANERVRSGRRPCAMTAR
jgi:hypothetical protein